MTLVTVIIPTFNRSYCLANAIDSVLLQTSRDVDVEIIVVDDGSTDGTGELVASRYENNHRVRYISQQNAGVAAARNAGLSASRGEFIALLDSDDVWKPWKLELQLACFDRFPAIGMSWTDMEAIDPSGRTVHQDYIRKMYGGFKNLNLDATFRESRQLKALDIFPNDSRGQAKIYIGSIFSQMILGSLVHTSTVVLRRKTLDAVGGFNEDLKFSGEDFDFHLRTCRTGDVGFIDISSITYQIGMPDALTRPEYKVHIAMNYLKTVLPVLDGDVSGLHLDQRSVSRKMASAYHSLAECQLDIGDRQAARQSAWRSLRYRMMQSRAHKTLLKVYLPSKVLAGIRTIKRRLTSR